MPLLDTQGNDSADAYSGGVAYVPTYIEQLFSTYLYSGNSSTQTITNNIDLSTKGGLVWTKCRTANAESALIDTVRGQGNYIPSNATSASQYYSDLVTGFTTSGYTLGADVSRYIVNHSTYNYVGWTFRKQPMFFDIVTYTGDGNANRAISHNLGSTPGCIIIKCTSTTGYWFVYHQSNGTGKYMFLNTTDSVFTNSAAFPSVTSTTFTPVGSPVGSIDVNTNGATYVAYLFAHNAGGFGLTGTDNVITCGSFTTDGSANATVSLGYEPQWVMVKESSTTGNWNIYDNMRGMPASPGSAVALRANLSNAETGAIWTFNPNSTGFSVNLNGSTTYIYIAIRRGPMAVPTVGTSVFSPVARTGTGTSTAVTTPNFPPDMLLQARRGAPDWPMSDRLRGVGQNLAPCYTSAESTPSPAYVQSYDMTGATLGSGNAVNGSGLTYIEYFFQRAPSFFDEVCYTGNGGVNNVQNHALASSIGMLIIKRRDSTGNWSVFALESGGNYSYWNSSGTGTGQGLNGTGAATGTNYSGYNSYLTTTSFNAAQIDGSSNINANGGTYVAYLFATCAGVSKVGTYTGNGTSQAIACGFTGGARFVLIKRTDATGDWYVYDTARGMTTLTDPYLLMNSTAAESATLGSVTTTTGGFTVNAAILSAINTNAASYIFFAVA